MADYETFVKGLGIALEWKINKDTKTLEYRDFTGPEKLLLIQNVNFKTLLANSDKTDDLQMIWSNFMDIINVGDLKLHYATDEANLEDKIRKWFKKLFALYQAKDVTPNMHVLHCMSMCLNF